MFLKLASCDWIRERHHCLLTGPSGVGKSWLACALGYKACRENLSVLYRRGARPVPPPPVGPRDRGGAQPRRPPPPGGTLILGGFGRGPPPPPQQPGLLGSVGGRH